MKTLKNISRKLMAALLAATFVLSAVFIQGVESKAAEKLSFYNKKTGLTITVPESIEIGVGESIEIPVQSSNPRSSCRVEFWLGRTKHVTVDTNKSIVGKSTITVTGTAAGTGEMSGLVTFATQRVLLNGQSYYNAAGANNFNLKYTVVDKNTGNNQINPTPEVNTNPTPVINTNTSEKPAQTENTVAKDEGVKEDASEYKSNTTSQIYVTSTNNGTINWNYPGKVVVYEEPKYVDVTECYNILSQYRSKAGLKKLVRDPELERYAKIRAKELVTLYAHTRPNGRNGAPSNGGENIAIGYTTCKAAMNGWYNSKGHREAMLRDKYTRVGIAGYKYNNHMYWVQTFGTDRVKINW